MREIQDLGYITTVDAFAKCVRPPTVGEAKTLKQTLVAFLIKYFPILICHVPKSALTYLVDGLKPPDAVFDAFVPLEKGQKGCEGLKHTMEHFKKYLENDHARLEKLRNDEFATEKNIESSYDYLISTAMLSDKIGISLKLKEHPNLASLITKVLMDHGEEYADRLREDEKAHVVGIGCRKIAEILGQDYNIRISASTVQRFYLPVRITDHRRVRDGGRYGFIETIKTTVRNSALCNPKPRGHYCAAKVRWVKELATWAQTTGKLNVTLLHIDDKAKVAVGRDGCHFLQKASHRGCTLPGDFHNNRDHDFPIMYKNKSMSITTTGIAVCYWEKSETIAIMKDKYGRDIYPRARPKSMFAYTRDSADLEKNGDATMAHWDDLIHAYKMAHGEGKDVFDGPNFVIVISDNGSGYNPKCERNRFWADKFMKTFPWVQVICIKSFEAHESALNFEIEHMWSGFTKALINFIPGSRALGGKARSPTNDEEYSKVMLDAQKECKELWEKYVNISEDNDSVYSPLVTHREHHNEERMAINNQVYAVCMAKTRKVVEAPENKDLKELLQDINDRSLSSFNDSWIFRKDCHTPEFKERLFGKTQRPLDPEEDPDLAHRKKEAGHKTYYKTFIQLKNAYKDEPQPITVENYHPNTKIPRNPDDKEWRVCCRKLLLNATQVWRHFV